MSVISVVIGTAGHIDHGKSALVEALTGTHPDRLKEERARGITIDLGFAHAVHAGVTLSFVDVPGHERFVRNMLAGAAGIDAVVLVVAADAGVQPQTREHFEICRLLGMSRGVIALTKVDLVDADTRSVAGLEVRELVRGSFLEGAPIIEVSVRTGEGLSQLASALASLATQSAPARDDGVRLPIDRVFTLKGFGTVVTGTLASGAIAPNDVLTVLPEGRQVRVRGVHVHGGAVERVTAPSRAAVNLAGVDTADLRRGDVLATPGVLSVTRRIDAVLTLLPDRPLKHGARLRVHQGTDDAIGIVSMAATRAAPRERWTVAQPGDTGVGAPGGGQALVRIRLRRPMVMRRSDHFILRAPLPIGTVAGGVVLDAEPAAAGIRRGATVDRLQRLLTTSVPFDVWLEIGGAEGVDGEFLRRRAALSTAVMARATEEALRDGIAVRAGDRYFAAAAAAAVERDILADVAAHHRAHPDEAGPLRESVRASAGRRASLVLVDWTLEQLRQRGVVSGEERLALSTHVPAAPDRDLRAADVLLSHLADAGLTPPDVGTLAATAGVTADVAERVLSRLARERRIVRLEGIPFHPDALAALRRDVRALAASGAAATLDVGTFKTRFGVSRKFAIPLLEWLDRERITRRVGDRRIVL